ncbi:MAG: ATP-binding protein [Leptospiraceae bacterium]|nr:ATP-binding protein [Leptospiraceae bacterium]MBK9503409.1 ATP-binding protein [Leptospiraceae bacterium]
MTDRHDIVPAHLAIQAMRDNGYKNTAYAIAELIDNSLQAGAKNVQLLCGEEEVDGNRNNKITRIGQIAILDDGGGMDEKTLRLSLQFGNGTHLETENQQGIGKFGMGLPASSISQCTLVEVWSWQDGVDNAIYTYLDLNQIKKKELIEIPKPKKHKIPKIYSRIGKDFGKSGTLVVWSRLDRILWRRADAIITNSEFLIGRLYRKFLDKKKCSIRMVAFNLNDLINIRIDRYALPNDPMYLMDKTSCPAPFDKKPMFEEFGDREFKMPIKYNGKQYPVKVRFSVAKKEARKGEGAGSRDHGKHASKNIGVSLLRGNREIELDKTWTIQYDPMERWWGIELDFPSELDELFGLTNNKQYATNFSHLAEIDYEEIAKGKMTIAEYQDQLEADEDPIAPILELGNRIKKNLYSMRAQIKSQNAGAHSTRAETQTEDTPEAIATKATREMIEEGFTSKNDELESLPIKERTQQIEKALIDQGLDVEDAKQISKTATDFGLKYVFAHADIQTPAFFTVRPKAGTIIITLNTEHPAYDKLMEIVDEDIEDASREELIDRLSRARDGLKLLLEAWARYEDTLPDGNIKDKAQEVRNDWGRMAKRFMTSD